MSGMQLDQPNYRASGEFVVTLLNNRQLQLPVSTAEATVIITRGGNYDVWSTVNVYVSVGETPVTTSNGYPILANNVVPVHLPEGGTLRVICVSGTGTFSYHKVN